MTFYRVNSCITCIERSADGSHVWKIASGEVLLIDEASENLSAIGLTETLYKGRNVVVFLQDLHDCAERLETRSMISAATKMDKREVC